MAETNLELCKEDWNSFETSWDFATHSLVKVRKECNFPCFAIGKCFVLWKKQCDEKFSQLQNNEELLNQCFIDLYGLSDEVSPEVEPRDVTIRKADL